MGASEHVVMRLWVGGSETVNKTFDETLFAPFAIQYCLVADVHLDLMDIVPALIAWG